MPAARTILFRPRVQDDLVPAARAEAPPDLPVVHSEIAVSHVSVACLV
jgi:hypothetical protein